MKLFIRDQAGTVYTNLDLGLKLLAKDVPELIQKEEVADLLPFSHTKVTYDEIPKPRLITAQLGIYKDDDWVGKVLALNGLLSFPVTIRFEDSPLSYDVRLSNFEQEEILGKYQRISLIFETTTPYRYAWQYTNEIMTEDWEYEKLGIVDDGPLAYDLTEGATITISNYGQVAVNPLIKITGSFDDFSIGSLAYSGLLNGELIIDCEKKVCYELVDGLVTNRKSNLSGDWMSLAVGSNSIDVQGTNLNIHLEIIYRYTYY